MSEHHPNQIHGPLWSLDGVCPRIAPDAWVAPTAVVIGDVELGDGSSIWFNAC